MMSGQNALFGPPASAATTAVIPRMNREEQSGRNWSLLLIFGSMTIAVLAGLFWLASAAVSLVSATEPLAFSLYCLDHIHECPTKGPDPFAIRRR